MSDKACLEFFVSGWVRASRIPFGIARRPICACERLPYRVKQARKRLAIEVDRIEKRRDRA